MAQKGRALGRQKWLHSNTIHTKTKRRHIQIYQEQAILSAVERKLMPNYFLTFTKSVFCKWQISEFCVTLRTN